MGMATARRAARGALRCGTGVSHTSLIASTAPAVCVWMGFAARPKDGPAPPKRRLPAREGKRAARHLARATAATGPAEPELRA